MIFFIYHTRKKNYMEIEETLLNSESVKIFENNLKSISHNDIKIETDKILIYPVETRNKIKFTLKDNVVFSFQIKRIIGLP